MDIPRSGNPLAAIAVLPALLMPLFHAKGEDFTFIVVACLGLIAMIFVPLLKFGLYARRTPLVRIDETSLTFFGNAQAQQRSFQRHAISNVSLSRRPSFWRSSFRLSVVADGETVDLWIPHSLRSSVQTLARALQEQFPGKFKEVVA
jgi:hypothetical protein